MARVDSIMRFRGKLGDLVHVSSSKYGPHVRTAPLKGRKRNEPAFKEQYIRANYLNKLASEINHSISSYYLWLKGSDLYQRILSRFRREPLNNRFLLLSQLNEMPIHRYYPFEALGQCTTTFKRKGNTFRVCLDTVNHPLDLYGYPTDAYYYELLLITWDYQNDKEIHSLQRTDWISKTGTNVGFDFDFNISGDTVHWLLCLRQGLCNNGKEYDTMPTNRVQFRSAGTFDPLDLAILEKRRMQLSQKETKLKKREEQITVVKARRANGE